MKFTILLALFSGVLFAQGHDGVGNGGSFTAAMIAGHKATLEQTSSKIRSFLKTNPELQKDFPEVGLEEFYQKTDNVSIEVVNEAVYDKDQVKRTCINLPSYIRCDINELELIKENAAAIFVLVFHELLGTMDIVDEFKISKRIAAYVTKTQNYDLRITRAEKVTLNSFHGSFAATEVLDECPSIIRIAVDGEEINLSFTTMGDNSTSSWSSSRSLGQLSNVWWDMNRKEFSATLIETTFEKDTLNFASGHGVSPVELTAKDMAQAKLESDFSLKLTDPQTLIYVDEHKIECTFRKTKEKK